MGIEEFGTKVEKDKKVKLKFNDETEAKNCAPTIQEDPESETHKLCKTQWAAIGDKDYIACASTIKTLKPGMYFIIYDNRYGSVFIEHNFNTDDLIDFPDTVFDMAEKEIENFWELNQEFKNYGFLHRRGFLLYGPAGGGKSCLVSRICRNIIKRGGIVFNCQKSVGAFSLGLQQFRLVEPNRQVVCIFEDIDALVDQFGEADILSLLDGENQVDHVINIATTNYPERMDKRIVSRPRRFDRIMQVKVCLLRLYQKWL